MRTRRVRSGEAGSGAEVELAVRVRPRDRSSLSVAPSGSALRPDENEPTVLLVHGYPDTGAMWDEVAERLAGRFRVITYDVRGAGDSTAPADPGAYDVSTLVGDLAAVLDAVADGAPVHLVGHDWGSVQGWEAVRDPRTAGRIASFTSISGPARRQVARWTRQTARSGPRGLAEVLAQARRSAYMPVLMAPGVGELAARALPVAFERGMRWLEGVRPRPGHPAESMRRDALNGLGLYRANMGRRLAAEPGAEPPVDVPVQVIVPTRDRYATQGLLLSARGDATRLYVRRAPAGHWIARSRPDLVARWVTEFVQHVAAGRADEASPALARARAAGEPGKDFGGRLAVVTGAGSGIGEATALAFADAGARVVAADIDEGAAKHTVDRITDRGGEAHVYGVDVGDAHAMERFAAYVRDIFGVPDVVVNNAGIGLAGPLLDTAEEDWARIRATNLDGVYRGCRLFGRQMAERGEGGALVIMSSMAAYTPLPKQAAYAATKAAVLQLGESLRPELEPHGIGVSVVCPGVINTPIVWRSRVVGLTSPQAAELRKRAARAFERRNYPPERVAAAVLRAVRDDRPVVDVTPEARVAHVLARLAPGLTRSIARMGARSAG